ncbi:hypothetical protein TQ39_08750 [Ruthenibacterium lactatiformans]|uniref:Uncharacterized protein n=1 Tax=Ruthenibacterium lactatiformans TaxID=1550024 RepID=A0A0D8IZW5_9FIRM|nr:hypothetical protein TQ39_08750 [Ruthenibacterium lactatiformans]
MPIGMPSRAECFIDEPPYYMMQFSLSHDKPYSNINFDILPLRFHILYATLIEYSTNERP